MLWLIKMLIIKTDKMNEHESALTLSSAQSAPPITPLNQVKFNNATNAKEILQKAKSSMTSSSKVSKDF